MRQQIYLHHIRQDLRESYGRKPKPIPLKDPFPIQILQLSEAKAFPRGNIIMWGATANETSPVPAIPMNLRLLLCNPGFLVFILILFSIIYN